MTHYEYDVVVVGLGPAGSSLTYLIAGEGLRVAAVDMVSWSGLWGKPCGDAIGKHHFSTTGLPEPEGSEVKQVVRGILVYSPSEGTVFRITGDGFIIDRNAYGRRLVRESERKGVELFLGTRALKPVLDGGMVRGVVVESVRTGKRMTIKAKVVVDASGNSGALKRRLPREWPVSEDIDPKDTNVAYREVRELAEPIENPEFIRIYLNQEVAPGGYWWFFPEGKYSVNVGLGVQGGVGSPSPRRLFYEKLAKRAELASTVSIKSAAGASVPTRRPISTMVWAGVVVLGDAAFTTNPLHGGGMGYAMYAALQAKTGILEAFERGAFGPEALWNVNLGYMRAVGAKQAGLDVFRIFLQRLTNEEIEYGMKYRVMKEEDAYGTSRTGEVRANLSLLDKIARLLRGLGKPLLLLRLAVVAEYAKRARELYLGYPNDPRQLDGWRSKVNALYRELAARLGA